MKLKTLASLFTILLYSNAYANDGMQGISGNSASIHTGFAIPEKSPNFGIDLNSYFILINTSINYNYAIKPFNQTAHRVTAFVGIGIFYVYQLQFGFNTNTEFVIRNRVQLPRGEKNGLTAFGAIDYTIGHPYNGLNISVGVSYLWYSPSIFERDFYRKIRE